MAKQISILSKDDCLQWNDALKRMLSHDFYHSYSYSLYYAQLSNQDPILFCFKSEDFEIVLPLIIRKIDNSTFCDITSSYGYVGPLSSMYEIPEDIIIEFSNALNKYCKENRVISAFNSLHPSFKNEFLTDKFGDITS